MLVAHYLPKFITALFGGLFVFLGITTFGNALLFDRIYLGMLVFTGIICYRDVNVVGMVVILFAIHILHETGWFISEQQMKWLIKPGFYLFSIAIWWFVRYDNISKVLITTIVMTLAAEAYWEINGQKAPEIYWYVFVMAASVLTRHLIFLRVSYTDDYFPGKGQSINMDWQLYKVCAVSICIEFLSLIEYLLRGVFKLNEMLYIYNLYPYAKHAISTYTLLVIFQQSYRLLLPKVLKA